MCLQNVFTKYQICQSFEDDLFIFSANWFKLILSYQSFEVTCVVFVPKGIDSITWPVPIGEKNKKCSSGSRGPRGPCPPLGPVKISHKKDGHWRRSHRFRVSHNPPYPAAGSATELRMRNGFFGGDIKVHEDRIPKLTILTWRVHCEPLNDV